MDLWRLVDLRHIFFLSSYFNQTVSCDSLRVNKHTNNMEQTNREILESRLNALKPNGKFQAQSLEAMKKMYFIDKADKLKGISRSKLVGHDFQYEMELGEKRLKRIEKIKSGVVKLERHTYAPELNCLHFKNGKTFKVNRLTDIDQAIMFAAIQLSEEQIVKYISAE